MVIVVEVRKEIAHNQFCPTENMPTNLLVGRVSDSPADRLVGYVQSCRRDSQDQEQNQHQDLDPEALQNKEQQEESPDVLRGPNEKIH